MSEEKQILDFLADGVIAIDMDFNIISFSEGAERITGYTSGEAVGKKCNEMLLCKLCAENCPLKLVLKTGDIISNLHFYIKAKDNRNIPVVMSISPLKNTKNQIIGVVQVFRNMAEVKFLTEEVLRERNKLQAILNSIADGVFTVDKEWKITSFNPSAEKITGVTSKIAVGKKCFEIFKSEICQKDCPLQRTLKEGKNVYNFELEIITKNRGRIPISISTALLIDVNGNVVGGVETFRDLSEMKKLKEEINGKYSFQNIIGKNKKMQEIYELIEMISKTNTTVLIQGETGTGKEMVAKAIHHNSERKDKPFVAINCGALPENLLESELFGHVKGAFTDAKTDRIGRFETANKGTLFLDEIAEASHNVQLKLLRIIETGEFEPVGSSKSKKIDVRIIAASNKNLKDEVKIGNFREDLYYRLNVVSINLPPLRERNDDIPLLVEHFINKFNCKFDKNIRKVSDETMDLLIDYPWPGNVRELENAIEHAFIHCREQIISKEHLPDDIRKYKKVNFERVMFSKSPFEEAEKEVISKALQENNFSICKTAKALKIDRTTLYRKIKKLKIKLVA